MFYLKNPAGPLCPSLFLSFSLSPLSLPLPTLPFSAVTGKGADLLHPPLPLLEMDAIQAPHAFNLFILLMFHNKTTCYERDTSL